MDSAAANLVALITGIAAIVTAVGGMILAIRAVRNKERRSAKADLRMVDDMLADERHLRIEAERRNYRLTLLLAEHGVEIPVETLTPPPETPAAEAPAEAPDG